MHRFQGANIGPNRIPIQEIATILPAIDNFQAEFMARTVHFSRVTP